MRVANIKRPGTLQLKLKTWPLAVTRADRRRMLGSYSQAAAGVLGLCGDYPIAVFAPPKATTTALSHFSDTLLALLAVAEAGAISQGFLCIFREAYAEPLTSLSGENVNTRSVSRHDDDVPQHKHRGAACPGCRRLRGVDDTIWDTGQAAAGSVSAAIACERQGTSSCYSFAGPNTRPYCKMRNLSSRT